MRRASQQARGYPSDLPDARWQVIAPHLPSEVAGRRGRPRVWPLRRIVEAILYLDRGRVPLAVPARRFPAVADGVRVLRGLA
jgi:putative transposase